MIGRQNNDQGPLFYEFRLDEAVLQRVEALERRLDVRLHAGRLARPTQRARSPVRRARAGRLPAGSDGREARTPFRATAPA